MDRFEGKVAIVTGAASGIGRAAVLGLASGGAAIVAADIDVDGARSVLAEAAPSRAGAVAVACDVSDPEQVTLLVETARREFGRLDLALNNAGMSGTYAPLADQRLDEWRKVIDVNLTSVFLCLQAEIPLMLESGGGAIVNTSSAAGQIGFANLPHYVASKHGVIGLTRSAALEFARQGVRVNAICPGMVRTKMFTEFAGGDAGVDALGKGVPIGRVAEPDEVAASALWLLSDEASYVTGHAMAIDGGTLAT